MNKSRGLIRKMAWALVLAVAAMACPGRARAQMDPYFAAINYPNPKHTFMAMFLPDFQVAHLGNNYFTEMGMVEYGITSRWTAGAMIEGQKIIGSPATYGGMRFNSYFQVFPRDRWVHFTLYGEYEYLNGASLYKMEVSGFGPEDLTVPLTVARSSSAHTFEQRAIFYHDWGRLNLTFNFINETDLATSQNDFGYVWGLFRAPRWMGMRMRPEARKMSVTPPRLSLDRLGYGVEMMGALGNTSKFGFGYWSNEQQYLGPVFGYALSPRWSVRVEPTFGLSNVSDPFVLRTGIAFSF